MALELNDNNFQTEVLQSDKPALVDFWAAWCGPCRMIAPSIEELAREYKDKAVIGKVDVDVNMQVSADFGIRNIPTLLFFKGGKVVDKIVGVVAKDEIENKLKALL